MISRLEAINIIKQLPLYRYECELDKGRQSDLFQALNKANSDMQKLEKIEKIIANQDELIAKIYGVAIPEGFVDLFEMISQIIKGEE